MSVHQGSGLPHGFVPSYLPGAASLVEELDQRLLIVLRDGRHLVGVRTFFSLSIPGCRFGSEMLF